MTLKLLYLSIAAFLLLQPPLSADVTFDLTTAKMTLNDDGHVTGLQLSDGTSLPAADDPSFRLKFKNGKDLSPKSITLNGNQLSVNYAGDWSLTFQIKENRGFVLFTLTESKLPDNISEIDIFQVALSQKEKLASILNAGVTESTAIGLMAAAPNIQAFSKPPPSSIVNRKGCSQQFNQNKESAKQGKLGVRFTATCDEQKAGWAKNGRLYPDPLNLSGFNSIRVWVHGDGKGELLKIQLLDSSGGYRDDYIKIDFKGWKQITLTKPAQDKLDYSNIRHLNLYYNGIPPGETVQCDIDQIEVVIGKNEKKEILLLEDFESPRLSSWGFTPPTLNLKTYAQYGLKPIRFALLATPRDEFMKTIERFEEAASLPSPKHEGTWLRQSSRIKHSYFFLTGFKPSQFDEAVKMAKRGGFDTILIHQDSWCRGTGHYETNLDDYPEGLPSLVKMVQRFKQEGFRVGFHVLGASLYYPDKYITPIPDKRLFKDVSTNLATAIDDKTDFIPTISAPSEFPNEDGGYRGNGLNLQIGDELIRYESVDLKPPYGFKGCQRAQFGTKATAHPENSNIHHLRRSFGYLMHDMDTTLLDEVTTNFAEVANACDIDMVYFDGSERLQGEHWYYNARLINAFYDKLKNKNTLMQASSASHYSWHILARQASADGHDDLKAYLDERSGSFNSLNHWGLPLDIGWYYGRDPNSTPDMFEYILGATLGYDASMSFQVSVDAAVKNLFTGEYLDLIHRFEKLRLSSRVDEAMRKRLRIDPILAGLKDPKQRAELMPHRQEYRLLGGEGKETFQRVMYGPWQNIMALDSKENSWEVNIEEDSTRVGVQFHALPDIWLRAGSSWFSKKAISLETFDDLNPYRQQQKGQARVSTIKHGESGFTSKGVSQSLQLLANEAPDGRSYALYEANNSTAKPEGWSMMQKSFVKSVDLSQHEGIGMWMRGDGKGGKFKLQLNDGKTALDFYIDNEYIGWRYQQLPWPTPRKIDLTQVRSMSIYYNGLPANTVITCAIDGIKAIPTIDQLTITNPYVQIGSKRIEWKGKLKQGEYVVIWPEEAILHYQQDNTQPVMTSDIAPLLSLPRGKQTVRFGSQGELETALRIRITQQPAERYKMSTAKKGIVK